ncbi:glycosylhydrolase-like jelly roll fold domain-containing protein [Neobacillus vireti]
MQSLVDMSRLDELSTFSGTIRYETKFDLKETVRKVWLELGEVYETVEVRVNGESAGIRISPPYRLEISKFVLPGRNSLEIEVTNTLVKKLRDSLSQIAQQDPSGLLGPIRISY